MVANQNVIIAIVTPSARKAWADAWSDVRELNRFLDAHQHSHPDEVQEVVSDVMTSDLHWKASAALQAREKALEVGA